MPNGKNMLVRDDWPVSGTEWINLEAEKNMETVMEAIRNLRNVRAEMDVVPSRKAKCMILASDKTIGDLILDQSEYLITLASCSEVSAVDSKDMIPEDAVSAVIYGAELYLPLDDLIDYAKEMDRLVKEKNKLEKEVSRVVQKLGNEGFVSKAPAFLLEEERQKQIKYEELLDTINNRIASIAVKL
jgi:valyl-tRNA synthetase